MDTSKKIQELEKEENFLKIRILKLELLQVPIVDAQTPNLSKQKQKQISPRELLNKYKATNDVERVLLFGYYLESIQNTISFSVDEIKNLFYISKVKLPLNINDKINLSIKKGHIMEAQEKKDNKKAWTLTGEGEKFVEELLK